MTRGFARQGRILRAFLAMVASVVALLSSTGAVADCKLKLTDVRSVSFKGNSGHGYEVFDRNQHSEVIEFKVERRSGSCSFVVGFSAGSSGSFGGRQLTHAGSALRYQLYANIGATQVLKDVPHANADEVLSGTLETGQNSVTFRLYYVIPLLQTVAPGIYHDSVRVSVYEGTLQSPQLRDQEQLRLSAPVPTTAEFSLGNSVVFGQSHPDVCLDFGQLVAGATRDTKLHARSNSGYRILFRSENGGALQSTDPRDKSRIPYTMEVDCQALDLGKGSVLAIHRSGITPEFGNEHSILVKIGEVGLAGPGQYRDVIQVTLYPLR